MIQAALERDTEAERKTATDSWRAVRCRREKETFGKQDLFIIRPLVV